jgi:hypothetical protein
MTEAPACAEVPDWTTRQVIFSGEELRLEYSGPTPHPSLRVVVAFPPYDYPYDGQDGGWGSRSFTKRGIAHVCVFHRAENWHQHGEFLIAMQACRAFFGPRVALTAYGFSMGGYAAMLGARALDADRAVAVSPQFSIDPKMTPFDRRYSDQWNAMGDWKHDIAPQMDDKRAYVVLYDPLHRQDRRQEALFPRPALYQRCLIHGAGHAGIQAIVEMGIGETLFDLLRGTVGPAALRRAYRAGRHRGFRYQRKMGTLLHDQRHPMAARFMEMAKTAKFHRLIKKWRGFYE